MKKTLIALALALAVSASMAVEVGVAAVHDYSLTSTGVRVTAAVAPVRGFTPQASVTRLGGEYTRYAVGAKYALGQVGPVAFNAHAATVYQDTAAGPNGFGLTAGLTASVPVTKNVSLEVGVERFGGQDRIANRDGNVVTVGLNAKF